MFAELNIMTRTGYQKQNISLTQTCKKDTFQATLLSLEIMTI